YAPWLGRWTIADPAGLADGLNVYRYAQSNPAALVDPTGTQSTEELPDIPQGGHTSSLDLSSITEEGSFTIHTTNLEPEHNAWGQKTGWDIVTTRTTSGIARRTKSGGWSYDQ